MKAWIQIPNWGSLIGVILLLSGIIITIISWIKGHKTSNDTEIEQLKLAGPFLIAIGLILLLVSCSINKWGDKYCTEIHKVCRYPRADDDEEAASLPPPSTLNTVTIGVLPSRHLPVTGANIPGMTFCNINPDLPNTGAAICNTDSDLTHSYRNNRGHDARSAMTSQGHAPVLQDGSQFTLCTHCSSHMTMNSSQLPILESPPSYEEAIKHFLHKEEPTRTSDLQTLSVTADSQTLPSHIHNNSHNSPTERTVNQNNN